MQTAGFRPGTVSRALARDRLGVPAVLFFVLAGVAPLTVAAGVIPTAYATTGLTGIPAAFLVIAVILAVRASGYVAMTRHITNGAQWLFLTSLFASALAFHNTVWRYIYALGRENVLPAALGRTGGNNIPKAVSLAQSATGLAVITAYALAGWSPMAGLFFGLGTTGGFGILILLALTAVAVIAFFARDARGETAWRRLIAPALAAVLLGGIVVLAVLHYGTLLGAGPGDPAAWALPGSYAAIAVIGLAWGLVLRAPRPQVYAAIGLGAHALTGQTAPARHGHLS
jgi:hypothetical protein